MRFAGGEAARPALVSSGRDVMSIDAIVEAIIVRHESP